MDVKKIWVVLRYELFDVNRFYLDLEECKKYNSSVDFAYVKIDDYKYILYDKNF